MSVPVIAPFWTYAYDSATIAVAIVAILGFFVSIRSSRQAQKTAERIQGTLGAMVEPLIKVTGYQWQVAKDGDLSPLNPPVGISVVLSSVSNVAVQLYRTELKTFFGDVPFTQMVENIQVTETASLIVVRGQPLTLTQIQPTEFPKYLGKPRSEPQFGPQFTIELKADFGAIGSDRRRRYRTRQVIYLDIAHPTTGLGRRALEETITDLAAAPASIPSTAQTGQGT